VVTGTLLIARRRRLPAMASQSSKSGSTLVRSRIDRDNVQ
jgi:hypothetical protein